MDCTPIIPWLGGKRRLADRLLALFPPHECYVEAFAGGAALFFLRPMPAKAEILNDAKAEILNDAKAEILNDAKAEILNDANGELINLYRVVQHHLEEFVRQFKWALSSRQVFAWLQATAPATLTDIQRAARFFYLQHHAFGGKVTGHGWQH